MIHKREFIDCSRAFRATLALYKECVNVEILKIADTQNIINVGTSDRPSGRRHVDNVTIGDRRVRVSEDPSPDGDVNFFDLDVQETFLDTLFLRDARIDLVLRLFRVFWMEIHRCLKGEFIFFVTIHKTSLYNTVNIYEKYLHMSIF